jgi:membrane associated rhomboid family serine protease
LKRAAEEPASLEALAPEERAVLAQGAEPPARDDAAFWAALREATPRGTYALAAVIAVVFAFQSLWGGSEFPLTLLRMGALVRGPILAGELWRLFSATFLHIGLVHVAMNLWALRVLGPFVEKVLGTPRFLVLYGLSALAGSLASVVLGRAGLAAGASGALWGLMAAEAAMTLRPGVLPESVRVQARSKAGQALLLNVMISFLPRIDMFAHFGGGLMGGLLVATGLFTRGLPRPGTEPAAAPPSFRLPAAVMALLMAASLAAATLAGRPWELRTPPAPALPHRLEGTPLSVAVPPRMPVKVLGVVGEGRAFLIGDDRQHPVVLWVWVGPGEELGRLRERVEGETAPEGATREGAVRVVDVAGVPTLVARSRFGDGALRQTWVTVRGAYSVRIQADSYEGASAAWLLVGESVVASLRQ